MDFVRALGELAVVRSDTKPRAAPSRTEGREIQRNTGASLYWVRACGGWYRSR